MGKAGENIRSITDDMRGTITTAPQAADKAPPEQKTAPTIQELSLEQTETSPNPVSEGTACLPCSRDHLSVTSSALDEAMRFVRDKGTRDPEVTRRIRIALGELNVMERIDLAPEETAKLKGAEKEIAVWTLNQSRNLRHSITAIKDTETMEQAAAQASALTEEFMSRLWSIPEEECETCGEARESIKRFIEQKRKGIAVEVGRLSPEDKERVLKRAEELVGED